MTTGVLGVIGPAPRSARRHWLLAWIAVMAISTTAFAFRADVAWLMKVPAEVLIPLGRWIDAGMAWFVDHVQWLSRAAAWILDVALVAIRNVLVWLPWPVTIGTMALVAFLGGGRRLATGAVLALLYIVVVGYWEKAMLTLALVGVAVPFSVAIGLGLGIAGAKARWFRRVLEPCLDLAQAMPAFAYIIPVLLLFGLSPTVAILTSAIFAIPPMTRSVMLGISRVPIETVESARMSGASGLQILRWVELPIASPTLLLGVNQSIMAAFSLVVFTAIVGGTADIGYEVLWRLRKSEFGESLLAGVVISLFAVLFDRTGRVFVERRARQTSQADLARARAIVLGWLAASLAVVLAAEALPALKTYPEAWTVYPAQPLNDAVVWFTRTFFDLSEAIKSLALYYLLLPIRVGLENAVRAETWGFDLTPGTIAVYLAIVALLAAFAWRRVGWPMAVAVLCMGGFLFHGIMGTPWLVLILVVSLLGLQVGGWRVGAFCCAGLVFIALTGVWQAAMMSIYLCTAAIVICFVVGGLLGIWAAYSDTVSRALAPVNDTLQTIPLFVFLIPVVMVFLHGDFAAVLAICMYAIVPAIRYTELGIRNVPADVVEASRAFGCTERQLLLFVKLPIALPEIMLGFNQVIVYALSMLIVTSLLGTKDLGQSIYEALTRAEAGKGVVAGLAIALIAMMADRVIQAWSNRKKAEYGLT